MKKMNVEIWSDVTCNFCYTAKRKFEKALSQFPNSKDIHIVWRSFEIAPGLKTDPNKFLPKFLSELKGISLDETRGMIDYVVNLAKEVGLVFNPDQIIPANSFNAHRLSHFAKQYGLQERAEERLYAAYFTEGRNIDDIPTLVGLGKEIGLDHNEVQKVFEGTQYSDDVRQDFYDAQKLGIRSVPFFVFDGKLTLSGAQDTSVFLETLQKAFAGWHNQKSESDLSAIEGQSCEIGKNCS